MEHEPGQVDRLEQEVGAERHLHGDEALTWARLSPNRVFESMARAHYENFPVASVLLPRHMRPHIAAVYAFARAADDFAEQNLLGRKQPDPICQI